MSRLSLAEQWEGVPPHPAELQAVPNSGDQAFTLANPHSDESDPNSRIFDGCPVLERVRDYARWRRLGPTALLMATLARLSCHISPNVQVDIGEGPGSLNLFVAVVGSSGARKSRTLSAAGKALRVSNPSTDFLIKTPGSGEGIISAYAPKTVFRKGEEEPRITPGATSVLWEESEVMNLSALKSRQGSTLQGFLTKLFTAEFLNVTNKDDNPTIEEGSYRAALILGVQPGRADALLRDADQGFPQRFIWVDTLDPSRLPSTDYPETEALEVRIPNYPGGVIEGCATAKRITAAASDQGLIYGNFNGLDAHANFARAKVAALLAVLRGHEEMTEDDWQRAGYIMAASNRARKMCLNFKDEATQAAKEMEGKRADEEERRMVAEIQVKVRNFLGGEKRKGKWINLGSIRAQMPSQRWRGEELNVALARMAEAGEIGQQQHPQFPKTMQYIYPAPTKGTSGT